MDFSVSSCEINSLLIVKLSALGDVVMSLPALWALRRRYPEATIHWLVEAPSAGLFEGHPALDQLIIAPRQEMFKFLKSGHILKSLNTFLGFRRSLRTLKYDAVLDLQGLLKSGLPVFMSRATRKVGFDGTREKAYWFLNEKMPPYDPNRHAVRRYLDAVAYLGAEYPNPEPQRYFDPPPEAVASADKLLAPFNHQKFVVLNPGAKWVTKRWPLKHWQSLAARLGAETSLKIVVTGGREDQVLGEAITESAPKATLNLCGGTSLTTLAAIMEKATLVVTGDTGPMHLAAAVGASGLALFGPTKPGRTGPFGGHFKVLTPDRPCLECLKRECPSHEDCLEAITPLTIWNNIDFR